MRPRVRRTVSRSAMARTIVFAALFFSGVFRANFTDSLIQEGFSKFLGSLATVKHVKTPELLNQLCNESQGADAMRRDACYGCFFRATGQPPGITMLLAMSTCADTYLNNTDYGHCQAYLRNATTMYNMRVSATTIYCTFLECVRQVNKDTLLRECVGEAVRLFPSFNTTDVQLAQLFVNTTACVLAKTRCSFMNPITGEQQEEDLLGKLQIPMFNAILVNSDYDINIVQLPFRYSPTDVCAKYRNVEQASWPTVVC